MIRLLLWVLAGAFSGAVAGKLMNTNFSMAGNLLLGIVDGVVGAFVIGVIGFRSTNMIGDCLVSILGGCLVIFIARKIQK